MHPFRTLLHVIAMALAAHAWQLRPLPRVDSSRLTLSRPSIAAAPKFRPRFFMSTEDTPEKDASSLTSQDSESDASSKAVEKAGSNSQDNAVPSGGLTRTLLLATPLFCKFVIVLVIKFLTDLVVFPLLFMYRLARLMKRRILKAFGRGDDKTGLNGRVNGANGGEKTEGSAS